MISKRLACSCGILVAFGCGGSGDGSGDGTGTTGTSATGTSPAPSFLADTYVPSGYFPTDPQRVIFLGDSITGGLGASSGSLTYPSLLVENDGGSWPEYDGLDLQTAFPGMADVIDVSRGGATTASLNSQQLASVTSAVGDTASGESIVVMTIGGNDMQNAIFELFTSSGSAQEEAAAEIIADVADNLDEMIDYLQDPTRFPDGSYIYMANVYDPTDGVGQVGDCFFGMDLTGLWTYFNDANVAFREVAEARGVGLIDMHGHFLGHGYYYDDSSSEHYSADDPSLWFDSDCIHPNNTGHHELRRLFYSGITGGE